MPGIVVSQTNVIIQQTSVKRNVTGTGKVKPLLIFDRMPGQPAPAATGKKKRLLLQAL